ncbi:MAG: branched-chain amino acid aminotransferase [Firmicutes bacterium]|nr:branched-chain amino acid aminotransferase [Bacillota bacterium]
MEIKVTLTTTPKAKPVDESKLGFGTIYTDHMFVMDYDEGQGWHDPQIVPFGDITLSPAAMSLHYGQETFEGLKGYRAKDGRILLFRPEENFKRLNASDERLCIPELPVDFCVEATKKLLEIDKDWVPAAENASMYIRPFIFATEPFLGVRPAKSYKFMIILSPSGPYYATGINPVKIYVENTYVRAVRGGTGFAKTGGNYAASMAADVEAHNQGYAQVLWLDGVEQKYVEEVGTMNIFFVIGDEVVTPMLSGSILPGITRKSMIEVLKLKGYKVTERRITIAEIGEAYDRGELKEIFGTGTAAVISPVSTLKWGDKIMEVNDGKIGDVSQMLYDELTGIQWGEIEGPEGWSVEVCRL